MVTGEIADTVLACVGEDETLRQAGHRMRELGVTALQVRGKKGRLHGVISRDMVVEVIARGGDPKVVTAGEVVPFVPPPARARSGFPARRPKAVA